MISTFDAPAGWDARTLRDFGAERVRDAAFDAVMTLWRRRRDEEGLTQAALAARIGKDRGWVSRSLRGPQNWTMATFGALVQGLNGEAEILVLALEDPRANLPGRDAYAPHRHHVPWVVSDDGAALAFPTDRPATGSSSTEMEFAFVELPTGKRP